MSPRHTEVVSIGVDVGGTKVLGLALGPDGRVLTEHRVSTPQVDDEAAGRPRGTAVADAIAEVVVEVATRTGIEDLDSVAIGVGIPGMVRRDGVLVFAPNLHGAIGADLEQLVATRLGRAAVGIDNDANCAALAEHHFGAARGVEHALLITLGTGIGGAAIVGGVVLRGSSGFAGEFGHLMVDPTGPRCPCGSRGCLERYASGAALHRQVTEAIAAGRLEPSTTPEQLLDLARAQHPVATELVGEFCWWLARGIANLCCCFDPSLVLLGGGVGDAHDVLLEPTRQALIGELEGGRLRPPPELVPTALGSRAGAIGAALVGEQRSAR